MNDIYFRAKIESRHSSKNQNRYWLIEFQNLIHVSFSVLLNTINFAMRFWIATMQWQMESFALVLQKDNPVLNKIKKK